MLALLVVVSIIFSQKKVSELFSRPLMNFTDDSCEALKNRYIQKLRYSRNKFLTEARNSDKAAELFGLGFIFTSELELDEFSQKVADTFNWTYDIGRSIDEILNVLIDEVRVNYLKQVPQKLSENIIKVRRSIWKIKLPFAKYYETYDYKGELTSRFKIKRDWSIEKFKRFIETESKEERDFMLWNVFIKKEYLFQKTRTIPLTSFIINPEDTDKTKWFKALVKYRAKKEFFPETYISELPMQEQKVIEQTREKRKKEVSKIVKWTDGRNKNNFVKLVYALHHTGLIDKGEGEVTNTVESLAPFFGIELGDWESNFSKGITNQGNYYDHGGFFDDLKKSYLQMVESKLENKQTKKKILKELEKQHALNDN